MTHESCGHVRGAQQQAAAPIMDEDDIATSVLVALDSPAALARVALVSRRLRALSKLVHHKLLRAWASWKTFGDATFVAPAAQAGARLSNRQLALAFTTWSGQLQLTHIARTLHFAVGGLVSRERKAAMNSWRRLESLMIRNCRNRSEQSLALLNLCSY